MSVTYNIDNIEVLNSDLSNVTVTFTDGSNTLTRTYKRLTKHESLDAQSWKLDRVKEFLETEVWSS